MKRTVFIGLSVLYFAVVLQMAWKSYSDPYYNWDTIPYMAIILEFEETDPVKIHQRVYTDLKAILPDNIFRSYTDTTSVTGKVYQNPNLFFQYTSFFRVKPLYTVMAYLAYKGGVPLAKAPLFPSVISFIGISVFLLYWLSRILPRTYAVFACLLIILASPLIEVLRLSTPDALSALILLIAFYFLLNSYGLFWIFMLLSLSILVRVDNAMVAFFMMVFVLLTRRLEKTTVILGVTAILVWCIYSYVIIDWANHDNSMNNFYGGLSKKLNPIVLVKDAIRGLPTLEYSSLSPLICIALIVLFGKRIYGPMKLGVEHYFFIALMLHILVKYIVLPDMWDRHYTATCIVLVILIIKHVALRSWEEQKLEL